MRMRCLRRRLAPGDGDGEYGWGERADALSEFVDCGGGVAVGVAHGDGVGDQCGVAVVADEDTRGSGESLVVRVFAMLVRVSWSAGVRGVVSVRVATRSTVWVSASGNVARMSATWADSDEAGAFPLRCGASTEENAPKSATMTTRARRIDTHAPRRDTRRSAKPVRVVVLGGTAAMD